MSNLISPAEYARRRGVSREAVSKAIDKGRISTIAGINGKKMIDPIVADIQWEKNTDPARAARANSPRAAAAQPPQGEARGTAYWDAHTRREIAAASREELLEKKLRGELVDRASVEVAAFGIGRMLRDTVFGLLLQLAPELANMNDAFAIETKMRDALRRVFVDITKITADDLAKAIGQEELRTSAHGNIDKVAPTNGL